MKRRIIKKTRHIFNGRLDNKPFTVVAAELKGGERWVIQIENIPYRTFRQDGFTRSIVAAVDTFDEADKIYVDEIKKKVINNG